MNRKARCYRTESRRPQIFSRDSYVIAAFLRTNYTNSCKTYHPSNARICLLTITSKTCKCYSQWILTSFWSYIYCCYARNWTRYPISEQDFRMSYAALFVDGVGSNPSDIRFLPLLFVVLAIAVRLAPEHIGGNAHERKLKSSRFYWACKFSRRMTHSLRIQFCV